MNNSTKYTCRGCAALSGLCDKVTADKPPSSKQLELKRGTLGCRGAVPQNVLYPAWCGSAVMLKRALGWEQGSALVRGEEHGLLGYNVLPPQMGLGRGKPRAFMFFASQFINSKTAISCCPQGSCHSGQWQRAKLDSGLSPGATSSSPAPAQALLQLSLNSSAFLKFPPSSITTRLGFSF